MTKSLSVVCGGVPLNSGVNSIEEVNAVPTTYQHHPSPCTQYVLALICPHPPSYPPPPPHLFVPPEPCILPAPTPPQLVVSFPDPPCPPAVAAPFRPPDPPPPAITNALDVSLETTDVFPVNIHVSPPPAEWAFGT